MISCKNGDSHSNKETWIGGEIVNPKSDYVILLQDHEVLDSIKLDHKNFFLFSSDCLKEGLYSFQHHEYQMFFLEPGDSLMLRVNTVDFDESLTYTGRGAAKNNFLMDLFLINESENLNLSHFYMLNPADFENKVDSLKSIKLELFKEFESRNSVGKNFREIAEASIDYDYYSKKEVYTAASLSRKDRGEIEFPKSFYRYREDIDLGNENLRSYYPYYRLLHRYFDNLAYEKYNENGYLNRYGYLHSSYKLKIIDSMVTCDQLKDNLLSTSAKWYLINGKDIENVDRFVTLFKETNKNEEHHAEIDKLYTATMGLSKGNKIPNVLLVNSDNMMKDLRTIISRPTVIYFWSSESIKHFKTIHTRANELYDKYPEFDFIGVNTDSHFKKWRDVVDKLGYDKSMEYQLEDIRDAEEKLVINSMYKAIIVDDEGKIIDGNTNLFNKSIESMLLGYLNQ